MFLFPQTWLQKNRKAKFQQWLKKVKNMMADWQKMLIHFQFLHAINQEIIQKNLRLTTTHAILHHFIIYLTKSTPKCRSSKWKTKSTLTAFIWSFQVCVNTMPRRKDISRDLREATVAAHQSGKGYKQRCPWAVHSCSCATKTKNARQMKRCNARLRT